MKIGKLGEFVAQKCMLQTNQLVCAAIYVSSSMNETLN